MIEMARRRNGMESCVSTNRISKASARPPRKPASKPAAVPTGIAMATEQIPTISETRAP
jgi:hypothetical protein